MESRDTCLVLILSQDMVFRVSVLAESRHLHVLSRLCLEFPCLVVSRLVTQPLAFALDGARSPWKEALLEGRGTIIMYRDCLP